MYDEKPKTLVKLKQFLAENNVSLCVSKVKLTHPAVAQITTAMMKELLDERHGLQFLIESVEDVGGVCLVRLI